MLTLFRKTQTRKLISNAKIYLQRCTQHVKIFPAPVGKRICGVLGGAGHRTSVSRRVVGREHPSDWSVRVPSADLPQL